MTLVFVLVKVLNDLRKRLCILCRNFLLANRPMILTCTFPMLGPVVVRIIGGIGVLTEAELCGLRFVTIVRSTVVLVIAAVNGLVRLSDEVNVISLQWEILLQAGPILIMLATVVGRWTELLALALTDSGVR